MEREPLSPEAEALWRRLWEIWQDNDEEDVVIDSVELSDLEAEIPGLENRMKTALAYLQRARYIQYRSGVGEDGIEPILYDVYEPRSGSLRSMTWLLLLPVALAAGMAAPTQFAINSQLRQVVGGPVLAAALSFLVGTVILFATAAVIRRSVPELGPIMSAPWWMWLGGLLGAFFVCASIILTPRLGAATTVGLFLAGQVIASIAIDHFGLLGVPVQHASIPRLLGALLIIIGVAVVQRF